MDIERGDGHLGGSDVEEVAAGVTRTQRIDTTVIRGGGVDPAGDGSTSSRIVRESDIGGSIENQRTLQIFHRDGEGFTGRVSMDVGCCVSDFRGAHRERISWLVRRGEGSHATVIVTTRGNPVDRAGAEPRFRGDDHAGRQSIDGRILIVGNRDEETGGGFISVDIRGGVGHLGGSHCEDISWQVGRGHSCDFTVITAGRSNPADDGITMITLSSEGHVGRHRGDRRILVVSDDHRVGGGRRVAMDIERGDGHLGGSHFEDVAAGMTRGQCVDTTVIRGGGVDPAGNGST